MTEFVAVIQHIHIAPDATTLQLDVAMLDVARLENLMNQEVTIVVRPVSPPTRDSTAGIAVPPAPTKPRQKRT